MKDLATKADIKEENKMLHAIKLDSTAERRLAKFAKQQGKSRTAFVHELVNNVLHDWELFEECDRRMADIHSGKEKTYTLEEVERELGLAN